MNKDKSQSLNTIKQTANRLNKPPIRQKKAKSI
jgi:hypothetical protein